MDISRDITTVKDLLVKTRDVLIVTHEHPTFDSIGSSLALYLGIAGLGKRVTVACPDPLTVELSSFVGMNKVINALGKKNFIISLDYVDGSIDRVSYNIENHKFNLVIEPRAGFEAYTQDKVHYSYAGSSAQVIFTVDTIHLGGLKKLYDEEKDLFASKPIINIDRHPNNAHYGHTNIVQADVCATAEIIGQLIVGLGISVTADIATNLLNALWGATNNFQSAMTTPEAFEFAAACMKSGGKRFGQPPLIGEEIPVKGGETVANSPKSNEIPSSVIPSTPQTPLSVKPTINQDNSKNVSVSEGTQTPPDWLKPKIFKSTNIS